MHIPVAGPLHNFADMSPMCAPRNYCSVICKLNF
jgi:hypothetical protein